MNLLPRRDAKHPGTAGALLGLARLARGRADGLGQFGSGTEAYLASLAPLVAFPLVFGVVRAMEGFRREGVALFLLVLCDLLAQGVIAELFCQLWRRPREWARYATVLNWMQWLLGLILLTFLGFAQGATMLGVPAGLAVAASVGAVVAYALWLHWFVARHALRLSGWRAAAVVAGVLIGTGLLTQAPTYAGGLIARTVPGVSAPIAMPPEPAASAKGSTG